MFQERLEDSWAYQEILAKGWEKGEKEGKAEGKAEGQLLALRSTLLSFVQIQFPDLVAAAMARVERIQNPDELQTILTSMFQAKSSEEALRILTDNGE